MRRSGIPAYLVALGLLVQPLLDATLSVWPLRPGEVVWRFGVAGLFSRALMSPLLALTIVLITALALEERRILRGLALGGAAASAALLLVSGVLVMDTAGIRGRLASDARTAANFAAAVALAKYAAAMVVALILTVAAWRASSGRDATAAGSPAPGAAAATLQGRANLWLAALVRRHSRRA